MGRINLKAKTAVDCRKLSVGMDYGSTENLAYERLLILDLEEITKKRRSRKGTEYTQTPL